MNDIIYINRKYLKNEEYKSEFEKNFCVRLDFPDEELAKIWDNFDWDLAKNRIYRLQCSLSKAVYHNDKKDMIRLQNKITSSTEGRMLAVRKVSEELNSSAGIDGVRWRTSSEKMRASISLTHYNYIAKPYRHFVFKDKNSTKERSVGVPCVYDRAMHVLYAMSLEPVEEAKADKRSFAFRKGRSSFQAHAELMDALEDFETGEWVLVADVEAYYPNISHEWLLRNIPMNKTVLEQFLKAGLCFNNGEIFPNEKGIELGCSLSPILGNMTLDGIQKHLYDLQGEKIIDYKNGWCLRFADDIIVLARSQDDAIKLKHSLEEFLSERGLRLSEKKTHIVKITQGFDFLGRTYYKNGKTVHCAPSEKSMRKFEIELQDLILNHNEPWTQKSLIKAVNSKLNGWASYHRISEAKGTFKHLDLVVSALLLKLMQRLNPNMTTNQIIKKFWTKDYLDRSNFSLFSNKEVRIINLEDTILLKAYKIDVKQNPFLEKEYFEDLNENLDIKNVTGRYKNLWNKQEGKCGLCGKCIEPHHERVVIFKDITSKDRTIRNMLYIHEMVLE